MGFFSFFGEFLAKKDHQASPKKPAHHREFMAKKDPQASSKKPAHHRISGQKGSSSFSEKASPSQVMEFFLFSENFWPRRIIKLLRKSQPITEFLAKKDHQASLKKPAHHSR
ncbi:uncharacterized protein LOC110757963 isoform X4 [Prunus avium]|uniref:Uncharacterized protein LOC110757963 isoform X4 n=1 Tax=Prunus avium TaxID=42229 RepID=A0A6P5SMG1_PRUAV|nr:uncharacterized protein LOC110757963 isoform X4 [Prunus avium]